MAYGTFAGVQALLPNDIIIDETTNPTLSTVEGWLPQLDSTWNVSHAAKGGTVPVTNADIAARAALLVNKEGAYMVMQVMGASEEKKSLFQNYHEDWLEETTIPPPEAGSVITPPGSSTGSPSSYRDQAAQLTREKQY